MLNTELTKVREEMNLSKTEFAKLLGITTMLLGKYEKGSCAIPDAIAEKLAAASDTAAAAEIEVKKTVRKAGRKAKEAAEEIAQSDAAAAAEIEVKKTVRKTVRKAKEAIVEAAAEANEAVMRAAGVPNLNIQSAMGGSITYIDIIKKVPKNTTDIYVRVDENKLYYVLDNGETGSVDIWE